MYKPKCLYVGHKYHKKTKSTIFFIDFLKDSFDLVELYIDDFSEEKLADILSVDYDVYCVFQYDFLTPYLVSNGKKVIVIPMYDGTGEMDPAHWAAMQGALFVNFSSKLHNIVTSLGLASLHSKYYPNPNDYPKIDISKFKKNAMFFWERRPSSKLSVDWLAYNLATKNFGLDRLHIHRAFDPGEYSRRSEFEFPEIFNQTKVTTSSWYESKSKYLSHLIEFNLFIAPRVAEGIGFSFLDSMACGQVVLAHDYPTMNEYIVHGENGFLFTEHLPTFRGIDLEKISNNAIKSMHYGHEQWLDSKQIIIKLIFDYLQKKCVKATKPITPKQASKMARNFFENQSAYYYTVYKLGVSHNPRMRDFLRRPFFKDKMNYFLTDYPAFKATFLNFVNVYKSKGIVK